MSFEYQDEHRRTLFRVVRTARKRFWQQRPDGAGGWQNGIAAVRRVLYRLPELLAADPDMPVYIPEGEKHVDALLASGRRRPPDGPSHAFQSPAAIAGR